MPEVTETIGEVRVQQSRGLAVPMLLATNAIQNSINPRVGVTYRHVNRNLFMLFLPCA